MTDICKLSKFNNRNNRNVTWFKINNKTSRMFVVLTQDACIVDFELLSQLFGKCICIFYVGQCKQSETDMFNNFFKEVVTNILFCFSPLLSNHFMNTKLHIYMWASFHTLYILLFRISKVKSEQHSISSAPFVMSLNRQNIVRSLNRYNIVSMKFSRNIGLLNELS